MDGWMMDRDEDEDDRAAWAAAGADGGSGWLSGECGSGGRLAAAGVVKKAGRAVWGEEREWPLPGPGVSSCVSVGIKTLGALLVC